MTFYAFVLKFEEFLRASILYDWVFYDSMSYAFKTLFAEYGRGSQIYGDFYDV